MERGNLTEDVAKEYIWNHVKFMRSYVLTSTSLDEAYYSWLQSKLTKD